MECLEILNKSLKTRQCFSQLTNRTPNFITHPIKLSRKRERRLNPCTSNHQETQIIVFDLLLRKQNLCADEEREYKFVLLEQTSA